MSDARVPVQTEALRMPLHGQMRTAYYARPEGLGLFPGIVVIHEAEGLNEHIRDVTRRFARAGYATLALDLFGERNRAVCMVRFMARQLVRPLDNASIHELQGGLAWLGQRTEVDAERLGAVGFCMGGSFVIAWACVDPRLKVIAPFYGTNPRPLAAVRRLCPVVGSYPGKDFTAGSGRKLDAALNEAQIAHDVKIYPGARHAFFNDQGAAFDPAASADAWQRVLRFFAERLDSAPSSGA